MPAESRIAVFSSENRANIPVYPLDVFLVTDRGAEEISGADTNLPAEALEILVLLDGKATVGDLEQKLPHIAPEALRNLVRALLAGGLVRGATIEESEGLDFSAFFEAAGGGQLSAGTQASADREATTGGLRLNDHGYYVSIARHAVKARNPGPGGRLSIFLVEDDEDLAKLVARTLGDEGFDVQAVGTRNEVVARLRQQPIPDLMILDVNLPDVNGFDILQRLKSHPALRSIPVIMLTAEATREGVMRGLVGGADGYITKPFKRRNLVQGVKAVLGL